MVRIFLPLSLLSTVTLVVALVLGLAIDDPKVLDKAVQAGVQYHFLAALAALVFSTLVHAIVLTYFMGTGRWIEETSTAYRLGPELYARSKSLKYQTIPAMVGCFALLIATGALGAAADPAARVAEDDVGPAVAIHVADGHGLRAEGLEVGARLDAGDPLARAVFQCRGAVQRGGELQAQPG